MSRGVLAFGCALALLVAQGCSDDSGPGPDKDQGVDVTITKDTTPDTGEDKGPDPDSSKPDEGVPDRFRSLAEVRRWL